VAGDGYTAGYPVGEALIYRVIGAVDQCFFAKILNLGIDFSRVLPLRLRHTKVERYTIFGGSFNFEDLKGILFF